MNKTFPTLFKKTSTGADQSWSIEVIGNTIISRWGQVGGALQSTRDTITDGKNAGRANATTPEQQAVLEAQAQWERKLKRGYVQDLKSAQAGHVDAAIEGGIFPMLAHTYRDHAAKIVYPAYAQPKLDGHRCIAMASGLWSRTRKPIISVPHINAALKALPGEVVLDGELYNHAYRDRFEELSSLIRPEYAKAGHAVVQYHVYDCALPGPFSQRLAYLRSLLAGAAHPLVLVETVLVNDEDELMAAFEQFRAQGYEGAMVRNANGLYANKRSYDLQKVKEFDDAEFRVTGVREGRGKLAGHGIFVCQTQDGTPFEAKLIGALAELRKYYENPTLAVGKLLTVQYQGFTNKSGVPRFPVALRIRD
jgi:DNA ligase-1